MIINILPFVFVLLIFLLMMRFMFFIATVKQCSMNPTLFEGDRVLVLRHWPSVWLRCGQIVVLKRFNTNYIDTEHYHFLRGSSYSMKHHANTANCKELMIKRIVGLPGDTVVVNISEIDELKQIQQKDLYDSDGNRVWHVPIGQIFIKGDYIYSTDSRDSGPVPMSYVVGIALLKLSNNANFDLRTHSKEY